MSIAQAERLKAELTDKYVIVAEGVPELRRFVGLTGTVKTVNMSCRALVQFNGPVDISWYDIDPSFLKVVDAPLPKKAEVKAEAAPAAAKPAVAKPAAGGKSPLDAIRAAGAAKPAAAPAAGGAKPSPLDMIRKQAAAKSEGAAPAAAPAAASGAALSPLEKIRQQAAAKAAGSAPAAAAAPEAQAAAPVAPAPSPEPVPAPEAKAPAAPAPAAAGRPKTTAEVLAAIRKQAGNK
ncbi:MAG: hypothetical protein U0929_08590 [Planctomycetaceae bacterium]